MSEGILCNRQPVTTLEALKALLADTGGRKYYAEMQSLDVDQEALRGSLKSLCRSRIKTWLQICSHCALCADACFLYLANSQDPRQVPSYKIQSTLGEMVRRRGKVDTFFMIRAMDVAWSQCTCCNRCGTYCPHGIDTGVMFSALRGVLYSQGFVPWEMKIGAGMHRIYGAQMDVTSEDFVETCEWLEEENKDIWPGFEIPVDKPNCDTMYVLNAREAKIYPQDLATAAILFYLAGESWTVPSVGWENTSISLFAGDWEACRQNVKRVYGAVERLCPKRVVGTECGHAHRATVSEGPYWAGRRDGTPPVPFLHFIEWLAEALENGRLKIDPAKRIKEPCTFQDSCNLVRNAGLAEKARYVMKQIAEDFREMRDCRENAVCCGGGGGFNAIGRYREERDRGLKIKLQQIQETGAKLVVASCHNCWDALRDSMKVYGVADVRWSFLKPLVLSMIEVPERLKPK